MTVVILCAMPEEAAPFVDLLDHPEQVDRVDVMGGGYTGHATAVRGRLAGYDTVVVTTGIGTTNSALGAAKAIEHLGPEMLVVAGTTGGLMDKLRAGDVVIGYEALYHDADATAFGYAPGQVPQMPAVYSGDQSLVHFGEEAATAQGLRVWAGQVGSANSFVTGRNAGTVRQQFPELLAVDMETAAAAQVCALYQVPWISIRAVSDLCDPQGAQSFHAHVDDAAKRSANTIASFLALAAQSRDQK